MRWSYGGDGVMQEGITIVDRVTLIEWHWCEVVVTELHRCGVIVIKSRIIWSSTVAIDCEKCQRQVIWPLTRQLKIIEWRSQIIKSDLLSFEFSFAYYYWLKIVASRSKGVWWWVSRCAMIGKFWFNVKIVGFDPN